MQESIPSTLASSSILIALTTTTPRILLALRDRISCLTPTPTPTLAALGRGHHEKPVSYEGLYTTDIIAQKADGFLEEAIAAKTPFFPVVAPVALRFNIDVLDGMKVTPPVSAERRTCLFKAIHQIVHRANRSRPKLSLRLRVNGVEAQYFMDRQLLRE